jgi:SAM-dependent methyltransferase
MGQTGRVSQVQDRRTYLLRTRCVTLHAMPESKTAFPTELFDRQDKSPDDRFYAMPRMVTHIDDTTIESLTQFYAQRLKEGSDLLDLMSSWVSHLPDDLILGRVAGLGMNAEELASNDRLDDWTVHDLNVDSDLPYEDERFDAVVNAVSVQYLVDPVAVFGSIHRVLRPGGISIVAMSHRCFPTKAIRAFHFMPGPERMAFVAKCHTLAGFDLVDEIDHSPVNGDPLWMVVASKRV